MNIDGKIYIYGDKKAGVLLIDYAKNLEDENKTEILEIFKKKYENDFIKSVRILLKHKIQYLAAILLSSGIDVLAKHYTGNISIGDIGDKYIEFLEIYFNSLKLKFDLKQDFYKKFRCSLVHSNSSVIDFTLDKEISKFDTQHGRKVINLNWLLEELKKVFNQYMQELESDNGLYENFLKVEKTLYIDNQNL